MRIYLDNGSNPMPEFQLPDDFTAEISRTNPFLTDVGSQSVPMTLPASEHNMKLIGWQYHLTAKKRPMRKTAAILSDNGVWMRGSLYIDQANYKEGISCTFYTNEGKLYENIKNFILKDLDWPKYTGEGDGLTAKTYYWMNHFLSVMEDQSSALPDYYIFSVTTDYTFVLHTEKDFGETLIINQFQSIADGSLDFEAKKERTYKDGYGEGATAYTVPQGYGVTPFLRLGYILRHIFEYFGYTLHTNIFDTDVSFKRLCLLNNTADAIVAGTLDYSQLLPEAMTVEDFINVIRKKFAIEFVEKNGIVLVRSWNQAIEDAPDVDLSTFIRNDASWIAEDKKAIVIECQGTRDMSEYTLTKTVLKHEKAEKESEEENVSSDDKTPFEDISLLYYYPYLEETIYIVAPYIGSISHKNSELVLTNHSSAEEEDNETLDLMFCFSVPDKQKTAIGGARYYGGTIWSYDNDKKIWGILSLVAHEVEGDVNPITKATDNLYTILYEERDKMLLQANQQIVCDARMPAVNIVNMDVSIPKIISGQKVLIERIVYVLGRPDLCQITARTLHLFPDETAT